MQGVELVVGTLVSLATTVLAFAFVSALVSAAAALAHRWYTREPVPVGLTVFLGLGVIAIYLNTETAFSQVLSGTGTGRELFTIDAMVENTLVFTAAALASPLGRQVGDHVATDLFALTGGRELEGEVGRIVRSVGRVRAVSLPGEIDDMEAFDPVSAATKAELAEKTLLFPRRLTDRELHDRFVTRLKDDYGVGYVDVEFEDGDVSYLALGSRVAGVGPTLAPGAVAVAVRADPPNEASPGDVVQVWTPPPDETRVTRGEVRAAVGDVVTLVVDSANAARLDPATRYRLVTLPATRSQDREFAALLRNAEETMAAVTVTAGNALDDAAVGDLEAAVVGVKPADGPLEAIPPRSRSLAPGETVYVVGQPAVIRRLEAGGAAAETET